ncbi:hypothetical protein [Salinibacter altiplanensis]|uniref:hypothetical protein n=1 Tax=Salinibacter altiplanensis TaxID=1803181 RepID=UPI0018F8A237|nr:hypothetical protein [Salinibacter altiplanensis]
MSAAHWHLVLNHIPLLGLLFGTAMLGYGLWRNQADVQEASLGLLAVAGLATIAVYLTGEPAEEVVEGAVGVSHDALEAHEHFAWYGLVAGIATGVGALGALLYGTLHGRIVRWTVVGTLVLALASAGLIGYTANLGGKISHPELRADVPVQSEGDPGGRGTNTGEAQAHEKEPEG